MIENKNICTENKNICTENKKIKVLIPSSYTWYNKGDAAITLGMIAALKELQNIDITVLSFTPEIDEKMYGLKVYSNMLNPYPYKNSIKYKITMPIKILGKGIGYMIWSKFKINLLGESGEKILKCYENADIIIGCGGGYLGGYNYGTLFHIFGLYFGKLLGKPVIISGASVNNTKDPLILAMTRFLLQNVDMIIVREDISFKYLKSIKIDTDTFLAGDYAFLMNSVDNKKSLQLLAEEGIIKNDNKHLVGITVRKWNFPGEKDGNVKYENYVNSIKLSIEHMIHKINARVIFFPQVIFPPRDDDREISNIIADKIIPEFKDNVKVLERDYSPEELKGMIGEMDLFIGTRMHSNIFSTSMNIPTVAIGYEVKTRGIMRMLDMEKYVIDIENISGESLISKIDDIWKIREDVHNILKVKIERMRHLAHLNIDLIKKFINYSTD